MVLNLDYHREETCESIELSGRSPLKISRNQEASLTTVDGIALGRVFYSEIDDSWIYIHPISGEAYLIRGQFDIGSMLWWSDDQDYSDKPEGVFHDEVNPTSIIKGGGEVRPLHVNLLLFKDRLFIKNRHEVMTTHVAITEKIDPVISKAPPESVNLRGELADLFAA
ncbi:MAG: hypothetical protein Q8P68_00885 [Candidatus Peregrinibacteria bacterium]|nr:hypothetical protein [Candidatus Peregrinibacteria bacterium]MDZ4245400.1 hypothetical protein [Candidatus Gracilibacteria bacterium]